MKGKRMASRVLKLKLGIFVLLLLFCTWPNALRAQRVKNVIDSITALLPAAGEDTNKITLLNQLAAQYPYYDPNKGLEVAQEANRLAVAINWDNGIARSLLNMGNNQTSRADYNAAMKCYEQALAKGREMNSDYIVGLALKNIGFTFYNQFNNPEALKNLFEALNVEERRKNKEEIFVILDYIGHVYEAQKYYDKALKYYKQSYDMAVAAGDNKAKAKNLLNIGQIYQLMLKYKESLEYFKQTRAAFAELKDEAGIAVATANIASASSELGLYADALLYHNEALKVYEKYADRINIASIYENLGKVYLAASMDTTKTVLPESLRNKAKNLKQAETYIKKSIQMSMDLSFIDGLHNGYQDLSLVYEKMGRHRDALLTYKQFITIRDSMFSSENNIKIASLEMNQEVAKRDRDLQLKNLQLSKRRNEQIFFVCGIIVLLLVTLALLRSNGTQKKLNETISKLVNEQEIMLDHRTEALRQTNEKLLGLVQFNVHQLREPITRIMGLLMMRKEVTKEEFIDTCLPMMETSVNDLDNKLKEVITISEEARNESGSKNNVAG